MALVGGGGGHLGRRCRDLSVGAKVSVRAGHAGGRRGDDLLMVPRVDLKRIGRLLWQRPCQLEAGGIVIRAE